MQKSTDQKRREVRHEEIMRFCPKCRKRKPRVCFTVTYPNTQINCQWCIDCRNNYDK